MGLFNLYPCISSERTDTAIANASEKEWTTESLGSRFYNGNEYLLLPQINCVLHFTISILGYDKFFGDRFNTLESLMEFRGVVQKSCFLNGTIQIFQSEMITREQKTN